jgi:nucleoside-triphosphatase
MPLIRKNILITGPPGIGKTTLIKKLLPELEYLDPAGFYTREIRERGVRKGFELIDLHGQNILLAHIGLNCRHRVGRYKVDISAFENYLENSDLQHCDAPLIIVDEIGKMECLSERFIDLMNFLLCRENCLIATVAYKGEGLIRDIKTRQDIQLYTISAGNRNTLPAEILRNFSRS